MTTIDPTTSQIIKDTDSDFVKRMFALYQQLSPENKRQLEQFVDEALGIVSSDAATPDTIILIPQVSTTGEVCK